MIKLERAPISSGKKGLNVTVKSAVGLMKYLAPTWDMVMGHKDRKINDLQYTEQYRRILNQVNWVVILPILEQNAENGVVRFLCYCADGKFCHTYLLIDYLVEKFPSQFEKEATHA